MKSKVFFVSVNESSPDYLSQRFDTLLKGSDILGFIKTNDLVALKMHFGEVGNTGYVNPRFIKQIAEIINSKNATSVVVDTNTLYSGRRNNSKDHLALAREHGFKEEEILAKVRITDDITKDAHIDQKHIKIAKIDSFFTKTNCVLGVAHFKGHIMTGFGGAFKNLGMGCATREGKMAQHSDIAPLIELQDCIGCGVCLSVCPAKAISLKNKKAYIKNTECIGCASCIASCKEHAIGVDWESGGQTLQEKMIEYAYGVIKKTSNKFAYINFAIKITKECDCLAKDDPSISPDIGIFASTDPVSIDRACFDSVKEACGKDIFKEVHPERNGLNQLDYAQELGLGSQDYELITL